MTDDRKGRVASQHVSGYVQKTESILEELRPQLEEVFPAISDVLSQARRRGKTVFVMGNGGSGAAASHFANDLNKYTAVEDKKRFKCVALTDNTPLIMALANDRSYEDIFVEQLKNLGEPGDVLIGISGSGESENCIRAIEYALDEGIRVVTWTGFGGGRMAELADIPVVIPSDSMVHCEDVHLIVHHCLVSLLRKQLEIGAG